MVQIILPAYLTEEQLYYYKKLNFKWEQFCFIKKKNTHQILSNLTSFFRSEERFIVTSKSF